MRAATALAAPCLNADSSSDLADLHALQRGDDAALNRLIARWQRPLTRFAWRYVRSAADAQELAAETFVRLYHHRQQLAADTNLSAWLFTTVANLCHNHHRWRQRHPTISFEEPDGSADQARRVSVDGAAPDESLEHREALDALTAAIGRMPHDLKVTLLLHHYERLSYREIGAIIHCSERGVETRLYRARQRLRAELGDYLRDVACR